MFTLPDDEVIPYQQFYSLYNSQGDFSYEIDRSYSVKSDGSYLFVNKPASGAKGIVLLKGIPHGSTENPENYMTPSCANTGCDLIDQVIVLGADGDTTIVDVFRKKVASRSGKQVFINYSGRHHPWVVYATFE